MLPTFTALSSAWLFALAVPVVIVYFLKLRRSRQVVPSLVLWRQVLQDQRVNSPFQRFKRNLLLLLQLLVLALLALAAMQPVLRHGHSGATRLPVLIDVSASMAALDKAGGQSRLAAAKARVRELIEHLPSDQEVCLVAFARTARRLTPFTNSRTELSDALNRLEVEDVAGQVDDALRLAQGLARTETFDRLWLISDGNFPAQSRFELPFRIEYQRVAPAGSNFGIVTCNARRDLTSDWEIFVQLAGSTEAESTVGTVDLRQGNRVLGSEKVSLTKGSAPRLTFRLKAEAATDVEVRYLPDGFDSLPTDNSAWLHLPAPRPLSAFAPESMASVRHALGAIAGVQVYPSEDGSTQAGYDLVITDRDADTTLPARVLCSFALIPAELLPLLRIEPGSAAAIDWRRDSPLLQHVTLDDVLFSEDPHLTGEGAEARMRELGYTIAADGPRGPLLAEKIEADQQRVFAFFHPDRSTLVYRIGFPVFITNLVQAALRRNQLSEVSANQTGVLPAVTLNPSAAVEITGPDQLARTERTDADGRLSGVPALRAGVYKVDGAGESGEVGAAVLSAMETSLSGTEQIEFAEQLKVTANSSAPQTDRALWWPLSCAALAILAIEWWWFNRRPIPA